MSTPDQATFYQPLRSDHSIRLLRRSGSTTTVPEFLLEEFDLSSCPSFIAASYTWGPPYCKDATDTRDKVKLDFTAQILVNCRPFQVTQNMLDALKCILDQTELEYIWMDQCCIDQTSTAEKASQVKLMHHIYGQAHSVVVWLGGHHEFADSFRWMVNDFAPVVQGLLETQGPDLFCTATPAMVAELTHLSKEQYEQRQREAETFHSLCRYFQRTWVRQEVIFAREIRVFCDKVEIMLDGLGTLNRCFLGTNWSVYLEPRRTGLDAGAGSAFGGFTFGLWVLARRHQEGGTSSTSYDNLADADIPYIHIETPRALDLLGLWIHVVRLQDSKCSDPKDKVYAALPLAARTHGRHSLELPINPDYTLSVEQVYTGFCKAVIQESGSLTMLAQVGDISDRQLTLPSWVKDFSAPMAANRHNRYRGKLYQQNVKSTGLRSTTAIRGDRLGAFGCPFATVTSRTTDHRTDGPDTIVASQLVQIAEMPAHIDGVPRLEALWRTLTGDSYEVDDSTAMSSGWQLLSHPAPPHVGHYFYAWVAVQLGAQVNHRMEHGEPLSQVMAWLMQLLIPLQDEISQFLLPSLGFIMSLLAAGPAERDFKEKVLRWTRAFNGMISLYQSQPVFTTREGFIGQGPMDLQVGDQVWFVHSCSVPLIFRPREEPDTYTLVGGCYLHGFMHEPRMFDPRYGFIDKWREFTLV